MSRVGTKIKILRLAKGLTQKQLARAMGVSEKYIEEVETGRRVLSDDLIKRASKVFEQDVNEQMVYEDTQETQVVKNTKVEKKPVKAEIQDIWSDAFESVLKTVQIYDYTLSKVLATRQLPIVSNKIEGFPKDKVLFLEIENNDMLGLRILKGDLAFAHMTHEVENNAICLVEYNNQRVIRQIKRLDNEKVLLISNKGTLNTDTVSVKNLKVLARLTRLEIKL